MTPPGPSERDMPEPCFGTSRSRSPRTVVDRCPLPQAGAQGGPYPWTFPAAASTAPACSGQAAIRPACRDRRCRAPPQGPGGRATLNVGTRHQEGSAAAAAGATAAAGAGSADRTRACRQAGRPVGGPDPSPCRGATAALCRGTPPLPHPYPPWSDTGGGAGRQGCPRCV